MLCKYSVFALLIFLISCKTEIKTSRNVERAFYHWKTNFSPTSLETKLLDSLQVKKLYVRFFDVDWDEKAGDPKPLAMLNASNKNYLQQFNIIPTVFITNECIYKIRPEQTDSLAHRIYRLLQTLKTKNALSKPTEIQIDCDWTKTTKEKYFSILNALQAIDSSQVYSVTIRLHQIKFMTTTGVPPVKKGMLMCYNMGNLRNIKTYNSILEIAELKKYLANLPEYPLHLDVALPIFEWVVLFRDNKYFGLLQNVGNNFFEEGVFSRLGNFYTSKFDTTIHGYNIKKSDVLRLEQTDPQTIEKAAGRITKGLRETSLTVSLYHLDSITLKKYSAHDLENIYDAMH